MVCSQNSKQLFLFSKSKLQLLETVFRLHFSKISFQPSVFFVALHGKTLVYKNLNFKQVSYESGTLHNHCSDNLEPNSKDISEYAVLCSLLRGSTEFFFLALHGKTLGYKNFEL